MEEHAPPLNLHLVVVQQRRQLQGDWGPAEVDWTLLWDWWDMNSQR